MPERLILSEPAFEEDEDEILELSSDPTEMLFQAMEWVETLKKGYYLPESWHKIETLKKAFAIYKTEE